MSEVTFRELVEARVNGHHPMEVVEAALGPDRKDDFTDDSVRVREFARIAGVAGSSYPYIGPQWVDVIATQLRSADPAGKAELVAMAQRNRDQYQGSTRVDAGGSFELWSVILKGLLATRTDEVPPTTQFIDKPEMA